MGLSHVSICLAGILLLCSSHPADVCDSAALPLKPKFSLIGGQTQRQCRALNAMLGSSRGICSILSFFVGLVEQSFYSELIMASFPDQLPRHHSPPNQMVGWGLELERKWLKPPSNIPNKKKQWETSLSQPRNSTFPSHEAFWWNSKLVTGPCNSAGHLAGSFGTELIPFLPTEHCLCAQWHLLELL